MLEEYLTPKMCRWVNLYKDSVTDVTLQEGCNMYLSVSGGIVDTDCFVSKDLLYTITTALCNGSIYANQQTLKKGFITLKNGYRVGMTGSAVVKEDGEISHLRNINAVNIRISRVVEGAAKEIINYIYDNKNVLNTLIIAPPGAGKTTILRDIAEQLGKNLRIGIADEREELFAEGHVIKHGFVMRGAKKSDAMLLMLRSMAPQVIITDEIGTREDEEAIFKMANAGVKLICTAHGYDENDVLKRDVFKELIKEQIFELIVVLSNKNGPGSIEKIIHTREIYDG